MAAPVRSKIDLSELPAKPVLRLVPPLPEVDEQPAAPKRVPAPRRAPRYRAKTRVAPCSPVIRRRRLVAVSVLVGVGVFLAVLAFGTLLGALTDNAVPQRTSVVWVQPGETLWQVAERSAPGYNPEAVIARIHELNDLAGNTILAGQALQVPTAH